MGSSVIFNNHTYESTLEKRKNKEIQVTSFFPSDTVACLKFLAI